MGERDQFPETVTLRVEKLALRRGPRLLFEDLSFDAAPGAFVELRGLNGAGKTSLLRAIAGFLRPVAGAIRLDGAIEPSLALHLVGHRDGLKASLDGRAHVHFWAALFGGEARHADSALQAVGLAPIADLPARALSQGQARRLSLARLIAAPRPLWLLDEPAAGLDGQGKATLDAMIEAHRKRGGIVVAALHEPLGVSPTHSVEVAP